MKEKFSKLLKRSNVESQQEDQATRWMLAVKTGDRAAYERLYNEFKGPIMTYIFSMTRDRGQAEELVHEVFLKIYRHRESYEPSAKFTTWAWTIARNTTLDLLKKKETQIQPIANAESEKAVDEALFAAGQTEQNAEELLIERSNALAIQGCIEELPPRQKEALLLRTSSEMSYEEISRLMDIQLAALKSLIHRAKEALTICLSKKLGAQNG